MFVCGAAHAQESIDQGVVVADVFELVVVGAEAGQSVPGAVDDARELGQRQEKVEPLGDEEKHEGLREVAEDGDHCECHSSEVAESVANKNFARIRVMLQQCKRSHDKRDHNRKRKEMICVDFLRDVQFELL